MQQMLDISHKRRSGGLARTDQAINSRLMMLFRPDGGEAVLARNAVAVDQLQPITLGHELVEGRLVLRGR